MLELLTTGRLRGGFGVDVDRVSPPNGLNYDFQQGIWTSGTI